MFSQFHWFQAVFAGTFVVFMGLMVIVVVVAYSRPSGQAGMDVSKIHKIRFQAPEHKEVALQP